MIFKSLLEKNKWEDIEKLILSLRKDYIDCLENFKQVFEELLTMKPIQNINPTLIEIIPDSTKIAFSWRVRGRSLKDGSTYNIDTFRWEEWLAFRINEADLENVTEVELVTCCLFAITSYGFTQDFVGEEVELERKMRKALENKEYEVIELKCPYCLGVKKEQECMICDGKGSFSFKEFHDETLN